MKKLVLVFGMAMLLMSCERVEPNYVGVVMENYGKNGKSDFTTEKGHVWVASPSKEVFQVPLFEQRAEFEYPLTLKSSDNAQFTASPVYSYKVIESNVIDVVFDNKQLGSGIDFMKSLEDNILEARIYDLAKEESRKYSTDTLMANGGSLRFEKVLENVVETELKKRGLMLPSFSTQLEFSEKVRNKIDTRNEVNTNLSVLDQQISEQRERNELAQLKAEENRVISSGITLNYFNNSLLRNGMVKLHYIQMYPPY